MGKYVLLASPVAAEGISCTPRTPQSAALQEEKDYGRKGRRRRKRRMKGIRRWRRRRGRGEGEELEEEAEA